MSKGLAVPTTQRTGRAPSDTRALPSTLHHSTHFPPQHTHYQPVTPHLATAVTLAPGLHGPAAMGTDGPLAHGWAWVWVVIDKRH